MKGGITFATAIKVATTGTVPSAMATAAKIVSATGYVLVMSVMMTETHWEEKDGQMTRSEPKTVITPQAAFRSVIAVMLLIMRHVCVTGRASVACVKSCEANWKRKDGQTNNSKTTIDRATGLTRTVECLSN